MYKLIVDTMIGDYVKSNEGVIYEVTRVSIDISTDENTGETEAKMLFEGVDAKDRYGQSFLISGNLVVPATSKEVQRYMGLNEDDPSIYDLVNNFIESDFSLTSQKDDISEVDEELDNEIYEDNEKRDVDEILDEANDYQELIELIGDEDGIYQSKLDELSEELKEHSK